MLTSPLQTRQQKQKKKKGPRPPAQPQEQKHGESGEAEPAEQVESATSSSQPQSDSDDSESEDESDLNNKVLHAIVQQTKLMHQQFQETQAELRRLKENPASLLPAYTRMQSGTHGEREEWMVTRSLQKDRKSRRIYMSIDDPTRPESQKDSILRSKLWKAMTVSLERYKHLYRDCEKRDVHKLVRMVAKKAQPNSLSTRAATLDKLTDLKKHKKCGYLAHEAEFSDMIEALENSGLKLCEADKVHRLLRSTAADDRYKRIKKELEEKGANYETCHQRLSIRAQELDNLADPYHAPYEQNSVEKNKSDSSNNSNKGN